MATPQPASPDARVRTLILTSSTGGGHNMRARSFVEWTRVTDGDAAAADIRIYQCLEDTHGLYRFGVGLYNQIQRHAPWAHHVYFNFLEVAALHATSQRLLGAARFRAVLDEVRPRLILSTHGSLNHGFFALAREHLGAANVRCVTYCGELFGGYGFSRNWVNPAADLFIGAVEECSTAARGLGMPPERTAVGGFLLDPMFYETPMGPEERAAFMTELGLDPDRLTLLLSTGEHGANNHLALLEALQGRPPCPDLQIVALCGRSTETLRRVKQWANAHPTIPVVALPHTNEMHRLMQVASAIVARPGTGTTSEAIMSGLPIIFNRLGGCMPQERITLRFAQARGFAAEIRRPADLPNVLRGWARAPSLLAALKTRIQAARPEKHPAEILRLARSEILSQAANGQQLTTGVSS